MLDLIGRKLKEDENIIDISTVISADGMRVLVSMYYGLKDFHVAVGVNAVVVRLSNGVVLNNQVSQYHLAIAFPELIAGKLEDWWIRYSDAQVVNLKTEKSITWNDLLTGKVG